MNDLTQERLKELLDYDPGTGVFRRLISRGNARAGNVTGCMRSDGYLNIKLDGKNYYAHRLAWLYVYGRWPKGQIDHINGVRDANGIKNLRVAKNHAEQAQNQKLHSANTSGFPGVTWHNRDENWQARIRCSGERYFLGCFDTPEEAAEAYRKAKARLHTFNPTARDIDLEGTAHARFIDGKLAVSYR